jgi:hypothetical protein
MILHRLERQKSCFCIRPMQEKMKVSKFGKKSDRIRKPDLCFRISARIRYLDGVA